jgi:hypothetical protein
MIDPKTLLHELRNLEPTAQADRLRSLAPSTDLLFDLEWEAAASRDALGHPEMHLGNGVSACVGGCGLIRRGNREVDLAHHPLFFATLEPTR